MLRRSNRSGKLYGVSLLTTNNYVILESTRVNRNSNFRTIFRYAVNQNNYSVLEDCKNIATLTSTVKLFLREMPEPLINREVINHVKSSKIDLTGKEDHDNLISQLKKSLNNVDKTSYRVLNFLLAHAKRVADVEGEFYISRNSL